MSSNFLKNFFDHEFDPEYHNWGISLHAYEMVVPEVASLASVLRTCREKGMTVIVITHNSALTPMADRVIKIRNGKVAGMKTNENPTPVEEIEW